MAHLARERSVVYARHETQAEVASSQRHDVNGALNAVHLLAMLPAGAYGPPRVSIEACDRGLEELEEAFRRGVVISEDYNKKKTELVAQKRSLLSLCIEALRDARVQSNQLKVPNYEFHFLLLH